jgi:hypothetical protein
MQWQSVIVLIGLNQLKIVNKISIQTHFGKKMAIALPAAAVIMHLWVWHPIIAIKTFVVGFLSSVFLWCAVLLYGFTAESYFRRNIFHWAGSPVMMEIYHEKKSTLKVSSNAWIIQHGINTTGLHWCFSRKGGVLVGFAPSNGQNFGPCLLCWFITTKSWSKGMVEEMYVCVGERWNLMTLLQTNKSESIHQLHTL